MVVKVHSEDSFIKCKAITYNKEKLKIKNLVEAHLLEQIKNAGTNATLSAILTIAYEYDLENIISDLEQQLIK